jgi:hypothetical protein
MSKTPADKRPPKLGDIVQFGMQLSEVSSAPLPAIVLVVHTPHDPESSLDIAVIGPIASGVSIQKSVDYSPRLGIGTWSWID